MVVTVINGCTKDNHNENAITTKNSSNDVLVKSEQVLSPRKLNIDGEVHSIGVTGNYYCYYQDAYCDNDEDMDLQYYIYDLLTDEIHKLGTISNFHTGLDSYAYLDNKFYFTLSCGDENGDIQNVHYQLDVEQKSLQVLRKDEKNVFNPLVSSIAVENQQYIEFEVEGLQEGYRYSVCLNDASGNRKEIISKKDNRLQEAGDLIASVAVNNNIIYTAEYDRNSNDWYIVTYSLEGTRLSQEVIPEFNKLLSTPDELSGAEEILWEVQPFHDYLFFRTMNRKVLVLKKESNSYRRINSLSVDNMEYVQSSNNRKVEQKEYLFFNRFDERFYMFHTDSEKCEELNLDTQGINYGVYEGKRLVYTTSKNEVYFVELP